MKFYLYGDKSWPSISLDGLLEMQRNEGLLWAHAETSGSESCYCEVARWNEAARRFERYAFAKCADYRFPELSEATDEKTAEHAAQLINNLIPHVHLPIVHPMPDWKATPAALGEKPLPGKTKPTEEVLGAAAIDDGGLFALYDFDRGQLIATEVFSSSRKVADEIDPRLSDVIVVRLVAD